ncbi:MAG: signal peptidase II [Lachnospiraceae bacterium]|nr:signal peptidase II [Lachnospiraceae bacterium]
MKRFPYVAHAIVCFLLVVLDQITKYFARTVLQEQSQEIWEGVFSLHYLENRGSLWGILQGKVDLLLIASVLVFAALVYFYIKMPKTDFYLPLFWIVVLMGAGGIGNTIDRVFFGYVTDFLYFELIDFPIFNVADCYITVGGFPIAFLVLFGRYKDDEFRFLLPGKKRKETSHVTDTDPDENRNGRRV